MEFLGSSKEPREAIAPGVSGLPPKLVPPVSRDRLSPWLAVPSRSRGSDDVSKDVPAPTAESELIRGTQYLTPCFRSWLPREEAAPGELLKVRKKGLAPEWSTSSRMLTQLGKTVLLLKEEGAPIWIVGKSCFLTSLRG